MGRISREERIVVLYVFFFQLTRFLLVLFLAADVHIDFFGRHAGYGRLLSVREERPHGLPVLQSIHPLPSFWPNHSRKLISFYYCPSLLRRLFCILPKRLIRKQKAMCRHCVCSVLLLLSSTHLFLQPFSFCPPLLHCARTRRVLHVTRLCLLCDLPCFRRPHIIISFSFLLRKLAFF